MTPQWLIPTSPRLHYYEDLVKPTALPRKTPLESKQLRNYEHFTMIPSCSNYAMLVNYATTGLHGAPLK